ncbi:MAG: AfsR/SARP family transcriptional regulator [Pseudonocardiaceae bacterium]
MALLGGFECRYRDISVSLPLGSQRLLALLALRKDGVHRTVAGERLWPDSTPGRAAANLRSALWRGRRLGEATMIDSAGPRLCLAPTVGVDLQQIMDQHPELVQRHSRRCPGISDHLMVVRALTRQLLPEWSEDWLLFERERWHQFRLHALENLATQLQGDGRYLDALQTALAAIAIEPIRETAHRIIVGVHLAEGNIASALQHYQHYRGLLRRELGVVPSVQMDQLVHPLMPS